MCCKSFKVLGSSDLSPKLLFNWSSLRILYCYLVWPTLKYGSVLWNPQLSLDFLEVDITYDYNYEFILSSNEFLIRYVCTKKLNYTTGINIHFVLTLE